MTSLKVYRQRAKRRLSKYFSPVEADEIFLRVEEKNIAFTPKKCGCNASYRNAPAERRCRSPVVIPRHPPSSALTEPFDRVLKEHVMGLTQKIAERFSKG